MPLEMVMHRNRVLRTLSGHTIAFEKGVAIAVPDLAIKECVQAGALPADGLELPETVIDEIDGIDRKVLAVAPSGQEREKLIVSLFKAMQANQDNHRTHFTAAGRPRSNFVSDALGFDVSAHEIEGLWNAMLYPTEDS